MPGRLVVDSRCRIPREDADNITVEFSSPLKAHTLSLASYNVPFSAPTVSTGCDQLTFENNGTAGDVRMRHQALESVGDLAACLSQAINERFPGAGITVENDPSGRLVVTSPNPFRLSTLSSSVARLLGIPSAPLHKPELVQYTDSAPGEDEKHTATFKHRPDLSPEPYLLLRTSVAGSETSPNPHAQDCMSVLLPGNIDVALPFPCTTSWSEFWRMTVTITRADGSRYDFDGADYRLEFLIDA